MSGLATLLGRLPPGQMTVEALEAVARSWPAALDVEGLVALASFSDRSYTRTPVHRGEGWELLLVGWLAGQRTAPHGHGESSGLTCVLEGRLVEVVYRLAPGGQLQRAERREHRAGGVFREHPHTIHHVEHAGKGRSVSVHLYAPPLARMELYEGSTGTSHPRGSGRRDSKRSISAR